MKFGICWSPDSEIIADSGALRQTLTALRGAGAEYLEFSAGRLIADEVDTVTLRNHLAEAGLSVEAVNSFIPGTYRLTGPNADHAAAIQYCRHVFEAAQRFGVTIIVLGSAGARQLPDGFNREHGLTQFCAFCRLLGPVAAEYGIVIAIEPLSSKEDNLIVRVGDGAWVVDQIGDPNIQLLADLYHIAAEREPLENTAAAGERLRHTHVADLGRLAPGYAPDGEEDFLGFFRALRIAGYGNRATDRCSFEGQSFDIVAQTPTIISLLRTRWEQSAAM